MASLLVAVLLALALLSFNLLSPDIPPYAVDGPASQTPIHLPPSEQPECSNSGHLCTSEIPSVPEVFFCEFRAPRTCIQGGTELESKSLRRMRWDPHLGGKRVHTKQLSEVAVRGACCMMLFWEEVAVLVWVRRRRTSHSPRPLA